MTRAAGINSGRVVKGTVCALRTTASSEPRRAAARRRVKIEPFRIKAIEPLHMTTREERVLMLQACHWNLFKIPAKDVVIDFLTDSGTGAMSSNQWSAMMVGDESYAGSQSWYRFQRTVQELTGHEIIIPTHQGRAAERILFQCLDVKGKGNIDLEALERLLLGEDGEVAAVVLTVTNNTGGGQPVSLENMRGAAALCKAASVPFYLDACRFAENAWFIKQREPGAEFRSIRSIANEMFSLADGCTFSAKKDGLANIGGFITTRDAHLGAREREVLILTEGYPTYGGLAGRDLDAIATGLQEVVDEGYLEYRIASTQFLAQGLLSAGVPIVQPAGGHAVYIDAGAMLPHIPPHHFPGHAVACAFFLEGGIRSCEIGSLMFGGADPNTGNVTPPALELCRMAIPRRVYTQSHIEYVLEVAEDVVEQKDSLVGFEIVEQPQLLRHFSASLRPLTGLPSGPVAQQAAEVDLAAGTAAPLAAEQPQEGVSPA